MNNDANPSNPMLRFFAGAAFPVFMFGALAVWQAFLVLLVVLPEQFGPVGRLAEDFRVWCFTYDDTSGSMEWFGPVIMLSQAPLVGLLIFGVWVGPLRGAWKSRRGHVAAPAAAGAGFATLAALLLFGLFGGDERVVGPLEFPGEEMRIAIPGPEFALENQDGQPVTSEDLKGSVVLMTAIYSTCGVTCPALVARASEAVRELAGPDQVRIVAISLDPENDTAEQRRRIADAYELASPAFEFLNGPPEEVNRVLDRLQVQRRFNENTQQIDHSNLFFLIDRQGNIAYRFTLNERYQGWLSEALQTLLRDT